MCFVILGSMTDKSHKLNTYGRYSVDLGDTLALFTVLDTTKRGQVQLLSMGYDAILCVSGKSSWSFFKDTVEQETGDLLFIPPGVYYHLVGGEESSIVIHLRFIDKKRDKSPYKNSKLGAYTVQCDELKEKFLNFGQKIIQETISNAPSSRSVSNQTVGEVSDFYYNLKKYLHKDDYCIQEAITLPNTSHRELVAMFFDAIEESNEIGVQEICDSLGYSESYIARVFKNTFGITPRQYYNVYKINKSLKSIKGDAVNLSTVSIDMGFSDQSHFTNVFKKFMMITPGSLHKGTSLIL